MTEEEGIICQRLLKRWLECRGIGSGKDVEVGVAMVSTRGSTDMAFAEGTAEIDG